MLEVKEELIVVPPQLAAQNSSVIGDDDGIRVYPTVHSDKPKRRKKPKKWEQPGLPPSKKFRVFHSGYIQIPKSSYTLIDIATYCIPDGDYLFRPRFCSWNGVQFNPALVKVKNNVATYCVMNLEDYPVRLPRIRNIGTFRHFNEQDLKQEFPIPPDPKTPESSPTPESSKYPEIITEEMWKQFNFGPQLTAEEIAKFKQVIQEHRRAFSFDLSELGMINCMEGSIDTGNNPPINVKQWPLSAKEEDELCKQVDENLKAGVIERSHSPYNSPVFSVPKAGTTERRFVQDYRALNKSVDLFTFPIPRIEDVLRRLSGSKVFCTVDAMQSF